MTPKIVFLVRRDVEPGWPLVGDHVPLGKAYTVDLDTQHMMILENCVTGREKRVRCVLVLDPGPPGFVPVMAFGMDETDLRPPN